MVRTCSGWWLVLVGVLLGLAACSSSTAGGGAAVDAAVDAVADLHADVDATATACPETADACPCGVGTDAKGCKACAKCPSGDADATAPGDLEGADAGAEIVDAITPEAGSLDAVVIDLGGPETSPPETTTADAPDAAPADAEVDQSASVPDVPATPDVAPDVAPDVDPCVPDCAGAACGEDGCGGTCGTCGTGSFCKGKSCSAGTECAYLAGCSAACSSDDACLDACYAGASLEGLNALTDFQMCLLQNCMSNPDGALGCIGAKCLPEYYTCYAGADATGTGSCPALLSCGNACKGDTGCMSGCNAATSQASVGAYLQLLGCLAVACPSGSPKECYTTAQAAGGGCKSQLDACVATK